MAQHGPLQERSHHLFRAHCSITHFGHQCRGRHISDNELALIQQPALSGEVNHTLLRGWRQPVDGEKPLFRNRIVQDISASLGLDLPIKSHIDE